MEDIARSPGDLRDAPYPDGASEFVDLHRARVRAEGLRKICPELPAYVGSGTRPSIYDLALLHAAARCRTVLLRDEDGSGVQIFSRRPAEDALSFHQRTIAGEAEEERRALPAFTEPVFALPIPRRRRPTRW